MCIFESIFSKVVSFLAGLIISLGLVFYSMTNDRQQDAVVESKVTEPAELIAEVPEPSAEIPAKEENVYFPEDKFFAEAPAVLVPVNLLNDAARKAVVNVLCTTQSGGLLSPATGSGMIIDSKGIILTSAHMAQYFLLKDYRTKDYINCFIRKGSPAVPAYRAELLFISSAWVEENSAGITKQTPTGTGENDFALLKITEKISGGDLSGAYFDFVETNFGFKNALPRHPVFLAGYPAGFLGSLAIQQNLGIVTALGEILEVFTFSEEEQTPDVLSLGGSIAAQAGSSGGAVIDQTDGKIVGLIVTSSQAETTAERDLGAITLSHIARSFKKSTGLDLYPALAAFPASFVTAFPRSEIDRLKGMLITELEK